MTWYKFLWIFSSNLLSQAEKWRVRV